ncbi:MAG: hypothetical protein Q4D61_01460 [Cardiobacteriaceae bacterium]|nr:hypothetical protein [Cardiobacteriaceae bacterium]
MSSTSALTFEINSMKLPAWNAMGILPPIRPPAWGNEFDRSPYVIDLAELVERFATSAARNRILAGLLAYRAALHAAGAVRGFQWLDGSFMEDVETLEGRAPRDMDVVTFFHLPDDMDQSGFAEQYPNLFDKTAIAQTYSMDAYFVVLGEEMLAGDVRKITYWYSMWSHRRDGLWKGFVQIDLDSAQDEAARAVMNEIAGGIRHA